MFFILIFSLNFSRESLKIDSLLCFPIFLSRCTLSIFRLRKRARYFHHQWIYFCFDTVSEVQLGFMYHSYQHCIKYRYFSLFPGVKILWKCTVSAEFRANRFKFPQNFHTKKSGEIKVFYAVQYMLLCF